MLEDQKKLVYDYLNNIVSDIKADALAKKQPIPEGFRIVVDQTSGKLYAADYFKYLIYGRGPGKMPPVESILPWAKKTLGKGRDKAGRFITDLSLAWAVARSIEKRGTLIFQGKKPGINFLGILDKNLPDLLETLLKNEAYQIATSLRKNI